ncbi:MAG TPA: type II secretion system F family protein [Anaerolineaceae bacterium]|nr:type II secretion system F family protein [Anaerolineaceae bacterium]HPN53100.1 type II secretion system F family protein [Anaerolineaceae bacterium]
MDITLLLIVGGFLALIFLIIGIVITISGEKSVVDERLDRYTSEQPLYDTRGTQEADKKATPLADWLNSRLQGSSFGDSISKDLAQADIKLKAGEYVAVMVIAGVGVGAIAYILGLTIIGAIVGFIIGLFLPRMYVKAEQGKRLTRFNGQLADMLNLMVNGLRAGYSTMQAMEAVSKELPPPICDEFRRVVQEMQLGVPMERALENLLRRIPSEDLDLVITAINVQREVGGNLAEILDTISFTIRERVRIKGEIKVLTAQQSYSGKFLSLLPVILMGILYVMNRDYMMQFFTNGICGYAGLACAGFLIIAGYFAMTKMAEVEI